MHFCVFENCIFFWNHMLSMPNTVAAMKRISPLDWAMGHPSLALGLCLPWPRLDPIHHGLDHLTCLELWPSSCSSCNVSYMLYLYSSTVSLISDAGRLLHLGLGPSWPQVCCLYLSQLPTSQMSLLPGGTPAFTDARHTSPPFWAATGTSPLLWIFSGGRSAFITAEDAPTAFW
jgi:hypothetical protein